MLKFIGIPRQSAWRHVMVTMGRIVFVFLAVVSFAGVILAQSSTEGAIGGTVFDPTRAVMQKALVTVRSLDTAREVTSITDSHGRFLMIRLQPGSYRVTVSAGGFTDFQSDNVVVEVGRVTELDILLALAGH